MTRPRIRRILLAVDGSVHAEQAAKYAARYATTLGRHDTIVLHVVDNERLAERTRGLGDAVAILTDMGLQATLGTRRILDQAGVVYRLDTQVGNPADVIAEAVESEDVDEVIIGSRGISRWESLFVGSVAYKVMHQLSVPITIVGTPRQEADLSPVTATQVHRALLAVDGSAPSARATEYISDLHKAGVALEVDLMNVVVPIPQGFIRRFASPDMIDLYYKDEGTRALHDAGATLKSEGVEFAEHIVAGHAAEEIVRLAAERRCTRIVMGTRGLGAVAGITLGSVAYRVIHLSPVPVTLVPC